MIRLLLFSLIRFFIAALAIYIVLTLIKVVMRVLTGDNQSFTRRFRRYPQQENPPKQTKIIKM